MADEKLCERLRTALGTETWRTAGLLFNEAAARIEELIEEVKLHQKHAPEIIADRDRLAAKVATSPAGGRCDYSPYLTDPVLYAKEQLHLDWWFKQREIASRGGKAAHAAGTAHTFTPEEAKAAGTKDPLGTLNKEMKKIQAEHSREVAKTRAERRNDPLGFLYDKSTGASYAVDKILNDEDLILAAASKFGDKSPEFNMLRQVYAQRILESTMQPGHALEKIAQEVQK
jgi:hypothetical protein